MPRINSASPDFERLDAPSEQYGYIHGADVKRNVMPVAFQITSPFNKRLALLPHALVMHVNPASWEETHTKKIEKIQTRGGFVEQHWFDELSEINANGSTGAFVNIYTGVSSVLRQRTIAWDRYRDLHDLYKNNGSVYDPYGNIVLQGAVLLLYDRGSYIGTFRSFSVDETEESPFAFQISWDFKVEETIMRIPESGTFRHGGADVIYPNPQGVPAFQAANQANQEAVGEVLGQPPTPAPTVPGE